MLVLVLLLCGTTPAWSEIYTWKEKDGTAHFTNSMYDIPDRYRSRAKVLNLGIEQKAAAPAQQDRPLPAISRPPAMAQPPAMVQPPAPPPKDMGQAVRPEALRRKRSSHRSSETQSEQ